MSRTLIRLIDTAVLGMAKRCCRQLYLGAVAALVVLPAGCDRRPKVEFVPPPPPEVTVANPVVREIEDTLDFTGLVRGVETVELRARVKGFLQEKHIEGGQRVKAGDLLFTIDPRTFEAAVKQSEASLSAREADHRLAEVTAERMAQAAKMNAASQQENDQAIAQREAAKAMVELARATLDSAKLDLEFTQVRAPIDGRLSIVNIDEGTLVGANEPTLLGTIINDKRVYAYYDIDEATVLELRRKFANRRPAEDGRPQLVVRLQQAGEVGYPHVGEFARADNAVNPETGTVRVEAVFDNPLGTILPGSFVRVQPIFGTVQAMLVPDVAVLSDQGGRYVMVVNAQDVAERRVVTVGRVVDRMRLIIEGLKPEDRVIINGLQRVRPDQKVVPKLGTIEVPALSLEKAAGGADGGGRPS